MFMQKLTPSRTVFAWTVSPINNLLHDVREDLVGGGSFITPAPFPSMNSGFPANPPIGF
jgi:hypothetical protein